jgi:hypothetical protein
MAQGRADFERLLDTLRAQPSRRHARDIFESHDWLFLQMAEHERELAYEAVDRVLEELPEDDLAPARPRARVGD